VIDQDRGRRPFPLRDRGMTGRRSSRVATVHLGMVPRIEGGRPVTDNRVKDRVRGLLGALPGNESGDHVGMHAAAPGAAGPSGPAGPPEREMPQHALQVLTLAQRTADEHLAGARLQAEKIHADARAAAEQTARNAEIHAHQVRQEADKVLAEARESSQQMARDARAHAQEVEREAARILAEAQARADHIAAEARANAEELKAQAEQRFQDVVGSLATKREALQGQIEALEMFDRDYRARLTRFMQNQLRALWVDEPHVKGEVVDQPAAPEPAPPMPAQRRTDKPHGRAAEPGERRAG
jgi:cell division septum initiation protein DivIVA